MRCLGGLAVAHSLAGRGALVSDPALALAASSHLGAVKDEDSRLHTHRPTAMLAVVPVAGLATASEPRQRATDPIQGRRRAPRVMIPRCALTQMRSRQVLAASSHLVDGDGVNHPKAEDARASEPRQRDVLWLAGTS